MIFEEDQEYQIESAPIPPGAIYLDEKDDFKNLNEIINKALLIAFRERNLKYKISKPNRIFSKHSFMINSFNTEIITTDIYSDQININLDSWKALKKKPQLILLAKIDEEYSYVHFSGVLTSEEFEKYLIKSQSKDVEFSIETDAFLGGIDRFFSFIAVLNPKYLSSLSFNKKFEKENTNLKNFVFKPSLVFAGVASLILGPNLISPRLQIASVNSNQILALSGLRSNGSKIQKICLLSPGQISSNSENVFESVVKMNRPIIFSGTSLKKVLILNNEKILWNSESSFESPIEEPITWPIVDITKNEKLLLRFFPINGLRGNYSEVKLKTSNNPRLIDLNKVIKNLGNKESRWIRKINKSFEKDQDLALALLFSKSAPETSRIIKARSQILKSNECNKGVKSKNSKASIELN